MDKSTIRNETSAPADQFDQPMEPCSDHSSTTEPFCRTCDGAA
jgi:hypothetical protein